MGRVPIKVPNTGHKCSSHPMVRAQSQAEGGYGPLRPGYFSAPDAAEGSFWAFSAQS